MFVALQFISFRAQAISSMCIDLRLRCAPLRTVFASVRDGISVLNMFGISCKDFNYLTWSALTRQ